MKRLNKVTEVEAAIIAPHDMFGALSKQPDIFKEYFGEPRHWELFWFRGTVLVSDAE